MVVRLQSRLDTFAFGAPRELVVVRTARRTGVFMTVAVTGATSGADVVG